MLRWCALGAMGLASVLLLWRSILERSRSNASRRLAEHFGGEEGGEERPSRKDRLLFTICNRFDSSNYGCRLKLALDVSGISLRRTSPMFICLGLAIAVPSAGVAVTGSLLAIPPALIIALLLPFPALKALGGLSARKRSEEVERFAIDLALYFRIGMPVEAAVALSAQGKPERLSGALSTFENLTASGAPAEDAFLKMAAELSDPDLSLMARATLTSRETGSEISGVMAEIAEAIRERSAVRRELTSQTIQGKLSGQIVAGLPFLFLALSLLVSGDTATVLFTTPPGLVMLFSAAALDIAGFLWIRKILKINI